MKIKTRDEIQGELKNYPKDVNVALLWSPRVGKTRGALNLLGGEKVLVVSNSELIRDSWKEVLKDYENFKSICYQSLKNQGEEWDTILVDECDLISENYYELLKELNPKRFIFLTGTSTFRSNQIMQKLCNQTGKELMRNVITMDEAIDMGILPVPTITCLGLTLRDEKPECLFEIGKDKTKPIKYVRFGEHFQYVKDRNFQLKIQCTEVQWHKLILDNIEYWSTMVQNYRKLENLEAIGDTGEEYQELKRIISTYRIPKEMALNILKQKGLERKNFLANKKNRYISRLFKFFKVENERVIVFANSIPQAEFINEDCVIHSKVKTKKGELNALEKFNQGINKTLVSVGMLERGVYIKNIHTSFILQIPNSEASATQKASRNLLDDTPRLVLVYFKGTKDEDNVKKFVKQFKPEYVKFVSVDNTKD